MHSMRVREFPVSGVFLSFEDDAATCRTFRLHVARGYTLHVARGYTRSMDSVRFGRVLGIGTRLAGKTLVQAVDAATAPNPNSPSVPNQPSAIRPEPPSQGVVIPPTRRPRRNRNPASPRHQPGRRSRQPKVRRRRLGTSRPSLRSPLARSHRSLLRPHRPLWPSGYVDPPLRFPRRRRTIPTISIVLLETALAPWSSATFAPAASSAPPAAAGEPDDHSAPLNFSALRCKRGSKHAFPIL